MNNFNQACPTGNHLTEGNPADEYNARARYNETHCEDCGEEAPEDILYENEGLCKTCFCKKKSKKDKKQNGKKL